MTPEAIFVRDGETFRATDLALGPWAPGALHGGAPAALIVHEMARQLTGGGLGLARLTVEFVRPVPQLGLALAVEVVRPGRRVTVLDATVTAEGVGEVCRARALWAAPAATAAVCEDLIDLSPPPFAGPADGAPNDWRSAQGRMFPTDGMEIRFAAGRFREPGPATAWFRLRHPLLADEPASPLELVAAAGDFGNGIASVLAWDEHVFINPDLTIALHRPPEGEWIALRSQMRVVPGEIAAAESELWDERGRIGRAIQTLIVGPRPA
jgi:hypothetical protein